MRSIIKIIAILIVAILIISALYLALTAEQTSEDNVDKEPPKIVEITGNTTGTTGKITTIFVTFSDNVNVTNATIFYRRSSKNDWDTKDVLKGRADLNIPSESAEDWYYYVTVDDKEGNGPVGSPSTDGSIYYTIDVSRSKTDIEHKVFIEDGTVSWCSNCPHVEKIISDLFNPDDTDFYFVSLVNDRNEKAESRLYGEYNLYTFPSVFFDGGYETCCFDVEPEKRTEEHFKDKISNIKSRDVPELYIELEANWNGDKKELETKVLIENYAGEDYKGNLRVYVAEIQSRWADWDGNPYNYAFLDYSINKTVTINGNDQEEFAGNWDSSSYSNIYPENLYAIAVIFNSKIEKRYSDPPVNDHPYNAHFADAVDGTRVANGTLPPGIGITYPQQHRRYILGNEFGEAIFANTLILGKIPIRMNIEADAEVEKVELTIKGRFKEKTVELEEPYEWTWDTFALGKYTIAVTVHDKGGRPATDELEVFAIILGL